MSKFSHDADDDDADADDAKAMTIPRLFFENSRAKKVKWMLNVSKFVFIVQTDTAAEDKGDG